MATETSEAAMAATDRNAGGQVKQIEDTTSSPTNLGDSHLLTGKKLWIAFGAILLSLSLIALDNTILATALPRIASDFDAFNQQGWVAASFILTQTAFILFFAQVLRIFPAKYVLLTAVIIFEIGSIMSAVSKDVNTLIGGRAVSGVGAGGILTGILQIMAQATRLEDRPTLFSLFESVWAIASIVGPLLGGVLTDHASWRWCFYINLPIGGVSLVAIIFLLDAPPPLGSENYDRSHKTMLRRTLTLDWVGASLSLSAISSLLLALQWGGGEKAWSSREVIACFVLAPVLAVLFVFWERRVGDGAMVPLVIFKKGISVYSISCFAILNRFIHAIYTYYIPIYYQAGRNHTATKSGVDLLPFMMAVVFAIVIPGQIVGRMGRYWPFLVLGPIFGAVGCGLMFTVTATTSTATLAGFQILVGICVGSTLQNILFAMQAEFDDTPKLISQASGMVNFCQCFGATIGLAIAQATFSSSLVRTLHEYAPDAPLEAIQQSPLSIYHDIPKSMIQNVIRAYIKSLSYVFLIGVPACVLSVVLAMFISNINIKRKPETATEMDALPPKEEAATRAAAAAAATVDKT